VAEWLGCTVAGERGRVVHIEREGWRAVDASAEAALGGGAQMPGRAALAEREGKRYGFG
jgi:hypothetical protein